MLALIAAVALASTATLHVGVHREAGTVYDVAADGAAGACVVGPSRISCPARGPVTFRWGPGGPWTLGGDTVVGPGETGTAFVLAAEEARAEARRRLAARPLDPDTVRALFLRAGATEPPAPSRGMIDDLVALASDPDPRIRRAAVDAMVPFWRRTASDPLPPSAPALIPPTLFTTLAADDDHRVRRRLAAGLRDLRAASDAARAQADVALFRLVADGSPGVQRAATAAAAALAAEDADAAEEAWAMALENVTREGAPGRAAANTLKRLRPHLDPARVDAAEAVHRVLAHHPERAWHVWGAWRAEVPFRRDWAEALLLGTVGLDRALLRHWAEEAPSALADVLTRWEPAPPHSERWGVVRSWLSDTRDAALRTTLELAPPTE